MVPTEAESAIIIYNTTTLDGSPSGEGLILLLQMAERGSEEGPIHRENIPKEEMSEKDAVPKA
jgi:hypothetical protein